MGKPGGSTATPPAPTGNGTLKSALADSVAQAKEAPKREITGAIVAGPFPVGNLGSVEVRAVQSGDRTFTDAVFLPAGGGKPKRIPLAAVATLHEELG